MNIQTKIEIIDRNIDRVRQMLEISDVSFGFEILNACPVYIIFHHKNSVRKTLFLQADQEYLSVGEPSSDGMAMIIIGQLCKQNKLFKTEVNNAIGKDLTTEFVNLYLEPQRIKSSLH